MNRQFRFTVIVDILLHHNWISKVVLIIFFLLPIVIVMILNFYKIREYLSSSSSLQMFFVLIVFFSMLAFVYQVIGWIGHKNELTVPEHIFILSIMAIYVSIIFSTLNYVLYYYDDSAYIVDPVIKKQEIEKMRLKLKNDIENVQITIDSLKTLHEGIDVKKTYDFDNALTCPLGIHSSTSGLHYRELYKFEINKKIRNLNIIFKQNEEQGMEYWIFHIPELPDAIVSERAAYGDESFKEWFKGLKIKTKDDNDEGVKYLAVNGEVITHLIQACITYLRTKIVSLKTVRLEKLETRPRVPMSIFLYQAVMDILNANPGYYKPANALSRFIVLIYSAFKYFFFGIFIMIVTNTVKKK